MVGEAASGNFPVFSQRSVGRLEIFEVINGENSSEILPVVCTEKDAAKLKNLDAPLAGVWFLRVSVELPEEAINRFQNLLTERAIAPRRRDAGADDELAASIG